VSDIVPLAISPDACSVMIGPANDVHEAVPPSVVASSEMACPPVAGEIVTPVVATASHLVREVMTIAATARAMAIAVLNDLRKREFTGRIPRANSQGVIRPTGQVGEYR
jgi:hypothetical protein